ncbi:MAG: hypothetical protein ACP5T0_09840 [Verrucomicrobiia bacterium]
MADQCGKYCHNVQIAEHPAYERSRSERPITENPVQLLASYTGFLENIFSIIQKEGINIDSVRPGDNAEALILTGERKSILVKLNDFISKIKRLRGWWQSLPQSERIKHREFNAAVQQAQNLMLKIITHNRENEQKLLRLGKVPPKYIPSAECQRPHYVAQLYGKNAKSEC